MFRKNLPLSAPLFLVFLLPLALTTGAFGAGDPEALRPWPESIRRKIRNFVDPAAVELSTALFNSANEFKVVVLDFPKEKGNLGTKFHRDVLDNFDLLNTYTVIDRVQLKAEFRPFPNLSTWTEDHVTPSLGTLYAGVVFEPQTSIEWVNVRPVTAFNYVRGNEPPPRTSGDPHPNPSPDPDLSEMNPDIPLAFFDPSIRARFSKIPNLLTFPFRLPLHRSDVSRMKDGEILGYAFDGQIEVGLAVGLKVIPSLTTLHAGIEARGTVVTHGRYQISVLRENQRYARVKLTHLSEKGAKARLKVGIELTLAKTDLDVIPFQWETSAFRSNQFDVIYRYDLDSKEGKRAFHKAVLGKFALSEENAERILSRDGVRTTNSVGVNVDTPGVLKLDWNRKNESLAAILELPDGTHHLFQGLRETRRQRDFLFKTTSESRNRSLTLVYDQELFEKHDAESIFLIAEVTEDDSSTKGRELTRAIRRMETFLRKPDLLPAIVTRTPSGRRKTWFGRSSFYYGYSLSWPGIAAFLRADRGLVEEKAEQYFGADHAEAFIEAWDLAVKAIAERQTKGRLFKPLKNLFIGHFPVEALTNVLFDVLEGHPIDTFLSAQNISFGRIAERGKTITSVDQLLTHADRELGFETYARRLKQDDEAIVSQLRVAPTRNGILRLRFKFSHAPENVFFRLIKTTGLTRQKVVTEIIINNRVGRFKVGENQLDLDPYSLDLLTTKLARELRADQFYTLSIAHARSSSRFGPVSSLRFGVNPPYPKR